MGALDAISSVLGKPSPAYLILDDYRQVETMQAKLKVHFNPSELQVYSKGNAVNKSSVQRGSIQRDGGSTNAVSQIVISPRVELTVNLIFDDTSNMDAFMFDKITGLGSVAGVVGVVGSLIGAKHSVQTEVEGLVAALREQYTRRVTFQWGTFSFTGELNTVRARYTMFSTSGRPIRATASIRVTQTMSGKYLEEWFKEYEKAFGPMARLGSPLGAVGNIINTAL